MIDRAKLLEIRKAAFDGSLDREQVVWLLKTIEGVVFLATLADDEMLKRFVQYLTKERQLVFAHSELVTMGSHSVRRIIPANVDLENLSTQFLAREVADAAERGETAQEERVQTSGELSHRMLD